MSYTDAEQIRLHLVSPFPIQEYVCDQPVRLPGTSYAKIYGGAIDESTVIVKSIRSHQPVRTAVTLVSGATPFSSGPVVPGSVVVASDSSLGTIYTENVDYTIAGADGSITPLDDGALAEGDTVTIWYIAYTVHTIEQDYALRAARGEIKRLASGNIAAGVTVHLDYQPLVLLFDDDLVNHAVALANSTVETELDPERQFEGDPNLSASATHRALEIVCRAAASRELAARRDDESPALAWLKIADHHATRAEYLIKNFRPPVTTPHPPERTRRRLP
jgi:hypothetical protein